MNKLKMIKDKGITLNLRLIIAFIIVTLIISFINLISFVNYNNSIFEFNKMIDSTIIGNQITVYLGLKQSGLRSDISKYALDPSDENVKVINDKLTAIDNEINLLSKMLKDKNSLDSLDSVKNMMKIYIGLIDDIKEKASNDAGYSEINSVLIDLYDFHPLVIDAVRNLISVELTFQSKAKKTLINQINFTNSIVLLLLVVFVVLIIISSILFLRKTLKPILTVTKTLKEIASGEGDLTKKIEIKSNDEIGILSSHFNDFIVSLSVMISQIKEVAKKTTTIGSDLAGSSQESTSSLEEIKINVENMKNKTNYLDEEISKSTSLSNEVKDFLSKLVNLVDTQASAIHESSSSIEEMLSSIKNLASATEEKYKMSNKLYNVAENGEKLMEDTNDIIKKIANSANIIMDLLKVINNTASQTSLLSMNAAIEAAHSGEYGKGFSVVADEIRKFAEETTLNSKQISKSLKELINYMGVSEKSTLKTSNMFKEMVSGIKEVSNSMIEMKNAMSELSAGSEQIMQALSSLVKLTEDVKGSYSDMDKKILSINESLNNVSMISTDTRNGMEEVTLGIAELYRVAKTISDAGNSNIANISELDALINKFKIEE